MADRGTSRIYVADKTSNIKFLIDTGADVSVIPRPKNSTCTKNKLTLFAANDSHISTYGSKLLTLNLNLRRPFAWPFIIADVSHAIIGIDFLTHFNLIVDVRRKRLIDASTNISTTGRILREPIEHILIMSKNSLYHKLLAEFPDLLNSSGRTKVQPEPKVYHHIQTTGPPVYSKPRRHSPSPSKFS